MAGTSRRTARKAAVKDWRARALRLHIDGFTLRQVAEKVGKALSTVHEGIEQEIKAITAPVAAEAKARRDEQREVEGARLEAVIRGAIGSARKGDPEAAHVVIAAVRQRAKLFGLEAPNRTELSGPNAGPVHFNLSDLSDDQLDLLASGAGALPGDAGGPEAAEGPGPGRAGAPSAREPVEG